MSFYDHHLRHACFRRVEPRVSLASSRMPAVNSGYISATRFGVSWRPSRLGSSPIPSQDQANTLAIRSRFGAERVQAWLRFLLMLVTLALIRCYRQAWHRLQSGVGHVDHILSLCHKSPQSKMLNLNSLTFHSAVQYAGAASWTFTSGTLAVAAAARHCSKSGITLTEPLISPARLITSIGPNCVLTRIVSRPGAAL
jgi:hypothetical protein